MKTLYLSAVFGMFTFAPAMTAHAHSSSANCNPCQSHHHAAKIVKRVIVSQPHTVYTAPPLGVTYAAPGVRLAGPPLISHTYHRGLTHTERMPIARAVCQIVQGECPAGTRFNSADGTCLMSGSHSGWSHSSSSSHRHSNTATYCYKNSPKRYDAHGHEIRSGCH